MSTVRGVILQLVELYTDLEKETGGYRTTSDIGQMASSIL